MKKAIAEKLLVLALFGVALTFFYVANEDAKKLGVLQNKPGGPALLLSNTVDKAAIPEAEPEIQLSEK